MWPDGERHGRYSEVQNMQVAFLCDVYSSPKVAAAFRKKMTLFARGELEHAVDVVMDVLNSGLAITPLPGCKSPSRTGR